MTHFIRQQLIHADLKGSESEGFYLHQQLSDVYYSKVLPALEEVMDKYSPPGRNLVINQLKINAGSIPLDRLHLDFAPAVAKAFIQQIESEIINDSPAKNDRDQIDFYYQLSDEKLWEAFVFFLKMGFLPWSMKLPDSKSLEELISDLLDKQEPHISSRIPAAKIAAVLKTNSARNRLQLQFSEHFINRLLSEIYPGIPGAQIHFLLQNSSMDWWEVFIHYLLNGSLPSSLSLPTGVSPEDAFFILITDPESLGCGPIPESKILEVLRNPIASNYLVTKFSTQFISTLLQKIAPGLLTELKYIIEIAEHLSFKPEDIQLFNAILIGKSITEIANEKRLQKSELLILVLAELQSRPDLVILVSKVFESYQPGIEQKAPNHLTIDSVIESPKLVIKSEASYSEEASAGIYIENAGLVLLHPFLPQFFESLEVTSANNIIEPVRALSLLHYLVSGKTQLPEYQLVLPKILCQLPLSESVPYTVQLTEYDIQESLALLDAVIKHWEALRNTSHDGLRGTFLLRNGKLTLKDDGDWLLRVESQTFDILLDQLPWGISMIKLPWMKVMLWVEWGT
jgi:hypothetical protein